MTGSDSDDTIATELPRRAAPPQHVRASPTWQLLAQLDHLHEIQARLSVQAAVPAVGDVSLEPVGMVIELPMEAELA